MGGSYQEMGGGNKWRHATWPHGSSSSPFPFFSCPLPYRYWTLIESISIRSIDKIIEELCKYIIKRCVSSLTFSPIPFTFYPTPPPFTDTETWFFLLTFVFLSLTLSSLYCPTVFICSWWLLPADCCYPFLEEVVGNSTRQRQRHEIMGILRCKRCEFVEASFSLSVLILFLVVMYFISLIARHDTFQCYCHIFIWLLLLLLL